MKFKKAIVGILSTALAFNFTGCGVLEKFQKDDHKHEYVSVVTPATCEQDGYTTYTCECGDSYTGDPTTKLNHLFEEFVSDGNATCEEDGTKTAICSRENCNQPKTVLDEGSALGHDFINYVSDDNYTCEEDGMETGTCSRTGCEKTDTRTEEGSARHRYQESETLPTCTEKGYTTYTCACGDSYVGRETDALGHNYVNRVCTRCQKVKPSEGLTYRLTDDKKAYMLQSLGSCKDVTLVVPDTFKGLPVTHVEDRAVYNQDHITSVVFGDNMKYIGYESFESSDNIKSITFGQNLKAIYGSAFSGCKNLTSVVLPEGLIQLSAEAFASCISLTKIIIPKSVTTIKERAFYRCDKLTIYCRASSKPSNWYSSWNYSNRPVVWGYTGE
jgi:hypothetical protein